MVEIISKGGVTDIWPHNNLTNGPIAIHHYGPIKI